MTYDPYGSGPGGPSPYGEHGPYGSQPGPYGSQPGPYGSQPGPYGSQGGPYGPQSMPPYGPMKPSGSDAAMWAHLGALLCYVGGAIVGISGLFAWLPALIIRKSAQNQGNPLVRNHTTQALNVTLTGLIMGTVALAVTIGCLLGGALASSHSHSAAPFALSLIVLIVVWIAMAVQGIAAFVFLIIATTKANSGQYFRYPRWWVAFPLITDDVYPE